MPKMRDVWRTLERTIVNRKTVLAGSTGAVVIATVVTAALASRAWATGDNVPDKLAATGDVVAGGAAALAVIAAVVAILAFAAATGTPDVELEINFKNGLGPGILSFRRDPNGVMAPGQTNLRQSDQLVALMKLSNRSVFSARNPGVRLELIGFGRLGSYQGTAYNLGDG